jgi:hypothetical protein
MDKSLLKDDYGKFYTAIYYLESIGFEYVKLVIFTLNKTQLYSRLLLLNCLCSRVKRVKRT